VRAMGLLQNSARKSPTARESKIKIKNRTKVNASIVS
jgi:hypothetical protein